MRGLIKFVAVISLIVAGVYAMAAAPTSKPEDFTVFPVGKPFQLSEARGKFVAIHFLLKTECPVCLRYTQEYAARAAELPDVIQVFLKPDEPAAIAKWMQKLDLPAENTLTIYHDANAMLATAFKIPDGYQFHGETVHYPALVLIDPDGNEVFRYVGKNNSDRFSFDSLVAKIAEIQKK